MTDTERPAVLAALEVLLDQDSSPQLRAVAKDSLAAAHRIAGRRAAYYVELIFDPAMPPSWDTAVAALDA